MIAHFAYLNKFLAICKPPWGCLIFWSKFNNITAHKAVTSAAYDCTSLVFA